MIDQIKCTHCNRQIFPFSTYLEIEKEELIAFCDQDCLNEWYKKQIEEDMQEYDQH